VVEVVEVVARRKSPPTSHEDSLVVVVAGGQGKKHPPTSRCDSLVVVSKGRVVEKAANESVATRWLLVVVTVAGRLVVPVGGRGKKHPPTCHWDTLVVVMWSKQGWQGVVSNRKNEICILQLTYAVVGVRSPV
jgi:hypothetical protein